MALSNLLTRLVALSLLFLSVAAQSPTTSSSATSPSSSTAASIYAGNKKWQYHGCFNESTEVPGTGGARALAGGEPTRSTALTVDGCFDICNAKGANFAGLEYTNECFCSQYVNSLAVKLPDEACNLTCSGNSSQYCGGPLKLTVYTIRKEDEQKKGAAVKGVQDASVGSVLALSVAMGMMLWLA